MSGLQPDTRLLERARLPGLSHRSLYQLDANATPAELIEEARNLVLYLAGLLSDHLEHEYDQFRSLHLTAELMANQAAQLLEIAQRGSQQG